MDYRTAPAYPFWSRKRAAGLMNLQKGVQVLSLGVGPEWAIKPVPVI
jgi:hypothetical protein